MSTDWTTGFLALRQAIFNYINENQKFELVPGCEKFIPAYNYSNTEFIWRIEGWPIKSSR